MSEIAAYKTTARISSEAADGGQQLVQQHAPLVKRIAYHLMTRLPPSVQAEDLIQAGMIGLLEASKNYDPTLGASFETYAGIRIRGAMLDEIRKGDWAPRSLHRKVREMARAVAEVEREKGRDARDAEVAEKLGVSIDEYYEVVADATSHRLFSLEELPAGEDGMAEGLVACIQGPDADVEDAHFRQALAKAVASLPERERLVLSLYYNEDLNLREAGEVLGVSESRVCQIHGQALIRLRARMSDWLETE
ncbi:MAG: RNA polymerase sigma factor FliA [Gammaproteobacteria bacterium]|nr:RNA polymerase sigma factor FliA [Gammaproteobacteria bacterium]